MNGYESDARRAEQELALIYLRRDDFYVEAHRKIFERMVSLSEQGKPIDPIAERLEGIRAEIKELGNVLRRDDA